MENETQREYSIGELADLAGVSTRTIRYYVSEGLLPPPVGVGPGSRYTNMHLEQLAIIGQLKEQYLPLKEIRRRLIGHHVPDATTTPQADAPRSPAPAADRNDAARHVNYSAPPVAHTPQFEQRSMTRSRMLNEPMPVYSAMPPDPTLQSWRRIQVAEGAELLISEDLYDRHHDKIDWLVQWAARVLE